MFDTLGGGTTAFDIRRESDNAEQSFTYTEVADGTYDTFISGSNGSIKKWYANTGDALAQTDTTKQIRLISNAGAPYVDDYSDINGMALNRSFDMSQDWIVTMILPREYNINNQRLNLGVRGTGTNLVGIQFKSGGFCNIVLNKLGDAYNTPDYRFSYTESDVFKLFTFKYIGGVFSAQLNDADQTLTANTGDYTKTDAISENEMVLGTRQNPPSSGKVTYYKHIGLITGDLFVFDVSGHNQALMTKYGI
jgi:hypothetical protein